MTQGLILAGGFSSRMKQNKMTLRIQDRELICHTIESMRYFVDVIYLVTGYFHEDIINAIHSDPKVVVIHNFNYEQGMFSSIQTGAEKLSDDFFLIPGDMPFIQKKTYQNLLSAKGDIRIPVFQSQTGHPIYIAKEWLPALRKESSDSTLRYFISGKPKTLVNTNDPGILMDVDTEQDYSHIKHLLERKEGPYED